MAEEMRLQKFLSRAGIASRRKAEELMADGKVFVNGTPCTELGTRVDPDRDRIEVDGHVVSLPTSYAYLLLNKPRGYVTTLDDPEGRPIVTDLLPPKMPRVWPVGRLDWDSEGLLLLTNDGELTHALTHPSHDVKKKYAVKIRGKLPEDSSVLDTMRAGIELDGEKTAPAQISIRGYTDKHTWIEVVLSEGRNRQIRRMCDAVGWTALRLRRVALGPLGIGGVSPGEYRSLTSDEVLELYDAAGLQPGAAALPSKRQMKRESAAKKKKRR